MKNGKIAGARWQCAEENRCEDHYLRMDLPDEYVFTPRLSRLVIKEYVIR